MNWLGGIFKMLGGIVWLIVRRFKRKDAHEPQKQIDAARKAAVDGNDTALNAMLGNARDEQLRDAQRGATDSE